MAAPYAVTEDHSSWKFHVDGSATWRVHSADLPLCNLLRHALLADVPVQAVEKASFYAWDGPIERSMVALRLGQLPVRGLEPLTFEIKVRASLDAPLTWVTSEDVVGDDYRVRRFKDGSRFLIAPLLAGQSLHVVCQTSLGTGRRRTQWSSVFPVMVSQEDGSCLFTVETTGACTAAQAWRDAITGAAGTMDAIAAAAASTAEQC